MPISQDSLNRFNSMEESHPAELPRPVGVPVLPCQKTWVAVELFRADSQPYAGAAYVITLPDGGQRSGTLGPDGYAIERDIGDAGLCSVSFPGIEFVKPR